MKLDSHQHFWKYDPGVHDWISDDMAVIRRNFLPAELQPLLHEQGIEGCVAVQADQSEKETNFLLQLAAENSFIRGVVGWVDLKAANLRERLQYYAGHSIIKGFRHVLQGETPGFMLHPDFIRGISALKEFGFTYDILIFPKHLEAAIELVRQFPGQPFVIDHIAKPGIKDGLLEPWQKGIREISKFENVHCKVSGMVTEANWKNWQPSDFTPYLDILTEAFGPQRIMYGSDWPVCQVAASYGEVFQIVKTYFNKFTEAEQSLIFGENAKIFYNI